jgi:hypothetical protein
VVGAGGIAPVWLVLPVGERVGIPGAEALVAGVTLRVPFNVVGDGLAARPMTDMLARGGRPARAPATRRLAMDRLAPMS